MTRSSRSSPAERLHPYARVYCAGILSVGAAMADTPTRAACALGVACIVAALSRLSWKWWLGAVVPTATLIAWMYALAVLSGSGSIDAITMGLFAARCVAVCLIVLSLRKTTSAQEMIQSLDHVRVPVLITAIAGSMLRWVDTLLAEARRMNLARVARGGDEKPVRARARDAAHLCASLMVRSYLRAERCAEAMECRGYTGRLSRASTRNARLRELWPVAPAIIIAIATRLVLP